ncbi:MAG TPA: TatD family hydrolase [Solirubrobacterales bacterium]
MVDTHAHIGRCKDEPAAIVARAREAGVTRILTVGLDERSNREAIAHAREFDGVRACVGRHPNGASGFDDAAAADILELARDDAVAAVGETGLDYFRDGAPRDDQRRAFRAQIEIARAVGKPLVIHMRSGQGPDRDAVGETLGILAAEAEGVRVILHCFSGTVEQARDAARRGWYCSFAGNATYPSAGDLREAARAVPAELLLVETDSPYLSPQSHRGKPNEPARVVETARVIAEERGVPYEELERTVEANAAALFQW